MSEETTTYSFDAIPANPTDERLVVTHGVNNLTIVGRKVEFIRDEGNFRFWRVTNAPTQEAAM